MKLLTAYYLLLTTYYLPVPQLLEALCREGADAQVEEAERLIRGSVRVRVRVRVRVVGLG